MKALPGEGVAGAILLYLLFVCARDCDVLCPTFVELVTAILCCADVVGALGLDARARFAAKFERRCDESHSL